MIKKLNVPLEVSLLLDANDGVCLYTNDNEHPSHSVSIDLLIDDWIDAYSTAQGIAPGHVAEAESLIAQMREAIDLISSSLPK
jgi:hypothetical protein